MQKIKLALIQTAVCAALGLTGSVALAHDTGYAHDTHNNAVIKSGFGDCWRTAEWTKDKATAECDASLAAKKAVAAPVAPVATVVQAPKPEAPKKLETLTLNANALFDFNKATLKDEGVQALSSVAKVLMDRKFDVNKTKIAVFGHTDRIGKADYNQNLSEQRASAAREQLVAAGIASSMIVSEGKGMSEPVTTADDCKKVLKNRKKLQECYAPDRRVEVQIFATVEQ